MHKKLPTQLELKAKFDYNSETGVFTRRLTGKSACLHKGQRYMVQKVGKTPYQTHRLIWMYVYGEDPGELTVDHIDRNPVNNRIDNLRLLTIQEQQWNRGSNIPYPYSCWFEDKDTNHKSVFTKLTPHGRLTYMGSLAKLQQACT